VVVASEQRASLFVVPMVFEIGSEPERLQAPLAPPRVWDRTALL
jgi:hypothetical protein